jgi:flagellar basal body rod protein FlgF
MVDLIQLSREFEMHVKLMKTMEENATRSNQLLDISK